MIPSWPNISTGPQPTTKPTYKVVETTPIAAYSVIISDIGVAIMTPSLIIGVINSVNMTPKNMDI